jgi:polyisoprenoid-binding protein YceI
MKLIALNLLFISLAFTVNAQKFMTKTGYIGFFSHTPMEDIKADNNQVASVLDVSTGEIVFQVLNKSFKFDRALMEEHFNENYIESDKYPRSTFKGKILNLASIDFTKSGKYDVTVEGDMNIHNVPKKITAKGIIEVVSGGINASSKFNIIPEDYNMAIPSVVREKIAKNMEVSVNINYTPLESK